MQHGPKLSVMNNTYLSIQHFESVGQSKWLIPQDAVFVSCQVVFSNINEKGIYNNAYTLYIARPPWNAEWAKQEQRQQ